MRKIDYRNQRILYPLFFILLSAILILGILQVTSTRGEFRVKTYRLNNGWGYQVLVNDRVYIDQPFIPVLSGKKPFPNRRMARKAGTLVKQKLEHRQLPGLTREDLMRLGLDVPEYSN